MRKTHRSPSLSFISIPLGSCETRRLTQALGSPKEYTLFTCTFCFPNTDHVKILSRFDPLSCSLKRVDASMSMSACTLFFNEQDKGSNLVSIITWSVLGKQNVQVKKVYYSKSQPNDCNTPAPHIAILLGATFCVRLAIMLRCVVTCWLLSAQVWKWSIFS